MPPADIDDMKICYVLLDGSNATSDIFYFAVEDNGKTHFQYLNVMLIGTVEIPLLRYHLPAGIP